MPVSQEPTHNRLHSAVTTEYTDFVTPRTRESVHCLRTYYMEFCPWVSEDSRLTVFQLLTFKRQLKTHL